MEKFVSISNKLYDLIVLADLKSELEKLNLPSDIMSFLNSINDDKIKGMIFSEIKKLIKNNQEFTLNHIKSIEQNIKNNLQKKQELRDSSLDDSWKDYINTLTSAKLQVFLRSLARGKNLPELNQSNKDKISKIQHFLQENITYSIDQYSFEELFEISEDWEKSFKQSNENYKEHNIVYGPNWKNPEFNGYVIVEIKLEDDLKTEGSLLDHCVGNYGNKLKNNISRIFSLRDPSNKPLITIEASNDLFSFKQTFGYQNSQPSVIQKSMINEWKNSLHPKDKILELALSEDNKKQINSAAFMDYSDPEYKKVIDYLLENSKDSGKQFLGSETSNDPKDVLQALASNQTLPGNLYLKIYEKAKNNYSTIYNLATNINLPDSVFIRIYNENKNDNNILNILLSSFTIGKSQIQDEIINHVILNKNFDNYRILLNNPSIKSSKIKQILNQLSKEDIQKIFNKETIKNSDPKLIDDMIESENPYLEEIDIDLLIESNNIKKETIEKLYKRYGFKPINVNKENFVKKLVETDNEKININILLKNIDLLKEINLNNEQIEILLSKNNNDVDYNLSLNPSLTSRQIDILLSKNNIFINKNLSLSPSLTSQQIEILLSKNDNDINYNLALSPSLTSQQIDILLSKNNNDINEYFAKNPSLTSQQIDILLSKNNNNINKNLAENGSLTSQQIDILLSKNDKYIIKYLSKNPSLTLQQIDILLSKNNNNINNYLALNKSLTSQQINILLSKNNDIINYNLAQNPSLTSQQIDILLSKNDYNINYYLSLNKSLISQQIDILLSKNNNDINNYLASNQPLTLQQIEILLSKNDDNINYYLSLNKLLTSQQIDILLSKNDNKINDYLSQNPSLTSQQIDILLNKNNNKINYYLAQNPSLTSQQIDILLSKNDNKINDYLSQNSSLTSQQIDILLSKNDYYINKYLSKNPSLTSQQIDILLSKNNNNINKNLAENGSLTSQQIDILLSKNDYYININLAENKSLTSQQIDMLLSKNDNNINYYLSLNLSLTLDQCIKLLLKNIYPKYLNEIKKKNKKANYIYNLYKLSNILKF